MNRSPSVERKLFRWMFGLSVVPALVVLLLSTSLLLRTLHWAGTLGPWSEVASSGADLVERSVAAAPTDTALIGAAMRHRDQLSSSLTLARRWAFVGDRVATLLPFIVLILAGLLAAAAWWVSRRMARQLAQPVRDLVRWTALLAEETPLPEAGAAEAREAAEFQALRQAFRAADAGLRGARRRAVEAERVRVWGEMARRVAHEMKNALTPLRLALHGMRRGGVVEEEPVRVIDEETRRLEELAGSFASLGRPPSGPTSEIDVAEMMQSLLRSDVPEDVEPRLEAAEVPLVEAHYDEVSRAVRNLIRNAVEAMEGMPAPRPLDVAVAAAVLPPGPTGAPVPAVEVRVGDRGHGLEPGAERLVFEPDFTTKSNGTGLGLALARQTIEAHGGVIEARRREGGGAEFVVRLPVRPIGRAAAAAREDA